MDNNNNKMDYNNPFFSFENQMKRIRDMRYKHSHVLKNKLNIKSEYKLNVIEDKLVKAKLVKLLINKENTLDTAKLDSEEDKITFLKNINKFIYDDLYDFAGKIRTENFLSSIEDGANEYVETKNMEDFEKQFDLVFSRFNKDYYKYCSYEEQVLLLSMNMSKLWSMQPFYKGNAISTVLFTQQFAERELGLELDLNKLMQNDLTDLFVRAENEDIDSLVNAVSKSISNPHKYDKLFDETSMIDQDEIDDEQQDL